MRDSTRALQSSQFENTEYGQHLKKSYKYIYFQKSEIFDETIYLPKQKLCCLS